MRKTLEGEEDLGGAGTPLSERGPYPPNLPDPPRTSPQDPALSGAKSCFAFVRAGVLRGSFLGLGGAVLFTVCGFALVLWEHNDALKRLKK